MNTLRYQEITPGFGAIVDGFVPGRLSTQERDELNHLLDAFVVLVFTGTNLSEKDQLEFAAIFGEPSKRSRPASDRAEHSEFSDYMGLVTNVRQDGVPIGSLPDGEMWLHHDGCFIDNPYRATILYALNVTSSGGETRFVDMRAVYRELSVQHKYKLNGLVVNHTFDYRHIAKRLVDTSISSLAKSAAHPAVIRHPRTEEPALYVNPLCSVSFETPTPEPQLDIDLLDFLFQRIERSPSTFSHQWNENDLVIWDNWASCHARNDFPAAEVRKLRRSIVAGQPLDAFQF